MARRKSEFERQKPGLVERAREISTRYEPIKRALSNLVKKEADHWADAGYDPLVARSQMKRLRESILKLVPGGTMVDSDELGVDDTAIDIMLGTAGCEPVRKTYDLFGKYDPLLVDHQVFEDHGSIAILEFESEVSGVARFIIFKEAN